MELVGLAPQFVSLDDVGDGGWEPNVPCRRSFVPVRRRVVVVVFNSFVLVSATRVVISIAARSSVVPVAPSLSRASRRSAVASSSLSTSLLVSFLLCCCERVLLLAHAKTSRATARCRSASTMAHRRVWRALAEAKFGGPTGGLCRHNSAQLSTERSLSFAAPQALPVARAGRARFAFAFATRIARFVARLLVTPAV